MSRLALSLNRSVLRRWTANEAGTVLMLFGLTLIPLLGFIGGAIDFANAYRTRAKLQSALDAATLAAGREIDMGSTPAAAEATANTVIQANLGDGFAGFDIKLTVTVGDGIVTATATSGVDTYILGLVGHPVLPIETTSVVTLTGGTVEVVMVLDNSGSMGGSRISDLKDAAKRLTQVLHQNERSRDDIKIGVVPFAAAVNVGPLYANATWMDLAGRSSIHMENFSTPMTRWAAFTAMRATSWDGCVEVRPAPHDVQDTSPNLGDPDSLFVPLFAPDEPDSGRSYNNDYLDDDGGICLKPKKKETEEEAQEKTCKYAGELPRGGQGPNYMCDPLPIQPLTNNQGQVISAIESMQARGMTNIMEGVMWGWRVLSPGEPFTEGLPYGEPDNRKFMIVMTDGANTHTGTNNQNMSRYSAFGYAKDGRLRPPTSSTRRLVEAMNEKTLAACSNAKATGIINFTIAFNINDRDTVEMLRQCASGNNRAFTINNGSALIDLFEAIANEINKLRISS